MLLISIIATAKNESLLRLLSPNTHLNVNLAMRSPQVEPWKLGAAGKVFSVILFANARSCIVQLCLRNDDEADSRNHDMDKEVTEWLRDH